MFVLDTARVVKWPVTVEVPIDGGDTKPQTFEMSFKLVATSDLMSAKAFSDVIVGWDGVHVHRVDGQPEPLPFTAENLTRMLSIPYVMRGVREAFTACMLGAKRKNSGTPLADGRAAATPAPATMQ